MNYLVMIGQLVLSLSILITLHEMGHFLPARWFKTRVEKFYLFFDPWFHIYEKQVGETRYGLGWLPLGGYVKIAGMVDESFDMEQLKEPAQPWEFRAKPAWQRLIIMLGGVTVNFLLGFFIYSMVLWHWGEEYLPAQNAIYGIHADTLGMELGLKTGDKILSVGNKPFDKFSDRFVMREIVINNARNLKVERDGQVMDIPVDPKYVDILTRNENKHKVLFIARTPFIVETVTKGSPAEKAGIKKDDQVISFNGVSTPYFSDFYDLAKKSAGKEVALGLLRNKDTLSVKVQLTEEGMIGVGRCLYDRFFKMERVHYTLAEAFPAGVSKGMNLLSDQVKAFGQMFKGKIKVTESLGGFGAIGSMFGSNWIWERFWTMTAFLSLILAFMNLLPIPALDGGHVIFLLYEVFTGRKPSDKFMEYATTVGFVLILGLVIFANGLDILRGCK